MDQNLNNKNMEIINKQFKDIKLNEEEKRSIEWLSTWETSSLKNIISAFKKAYKK